MNEAIEQMTKATDYRRKLREMGDWDAFLLAESGLPGPRGNLELVEAAADEGDEARFRRWLTNTCDIAPANTQREFLAVCGAVGLGRLLAEGRRDLVPALRRCASDSRWRMREGVAMALQRWGDADMDALIGEMELWSAGGLLEKRAAAAALCEPRLLRDPAQIRRVLAILDEITASIAPEADRMGEDFLALRKGLGYCWSVAVAAYPEAGKSYIEKWLATSDPQIRWIVRENLKKDRLRRMDPAWVMATQARLGANPT